MTGDISNMSLSEIEQELTELEDSYGEAMKDGASAETLKFIWDRIKELQEEFGSRK